MRYLALATDYDGTLAHDGVVDDKTIEALKRLRHSGRKLIMVTGREIPDLESVFDRLDLFDCIVAENGALLYTPATREKTVLGQRPPDAFIAALKQRGVGPMSVGDVIIATWHPHEMTVLETIRDFGLEFQVIFNKDAVMILPAGINKMSGLTQALRDLRLSRHNIVGIGDAENDHAFLGCCECSVAVANAIPALKERVDIVMDEDHGAAVAAIIDRMVEDDLRSLRLDNPRHRLPLGRLDDRDVYVQAYGRNMLLIGPSGSGKSTFVSGFLEQLVARGYQTCLVDPEGDYEGLEGFLTIGDEDHGPSFEQVFQLLDRPDSNLIISLLGVKMQDRPHFFASLLAKLQDKSNKEARPHWLIIDEAHHLLPSEWAPASAEVAGQTMSMLLVTVHPEHVSPAALKPIQIVSVVGKDPQKSADEFAAAVGIKAPRFEPGDLAQGEASVWFCETGEVFNHVRTLPGKAERKRHKRKYAEGELEPERVFVFKGAENKLNLRVQNLRTFLQISEGIDDETWLFHLNRGEYSGWFRDKIKDRDLAADVERVEQNKDLSPVDSRKEIAKAIEARYTAPA
jgi:HAD superfamily hydrolase (TIGR01484 family)